MTKLEILRERRKMYLRAEAEILDNGQTVELEGLKLTRANLGTLRKELHEIEIAIQKEEGVMARSRKGRVRVVIPI